MMGVQEDRWFSRDCRRPAEYGWISLISFQDTSVLKAAFLQEFFNGGGALPDGLGIEAGKAYAGYPDKVLQRVQKFIFMGIEIGECGMQILGIGHRSTFS